MNVFKKVLIDVLKSNRTKTFLWQTAIGFISLITMYATAIQPEVIDPTGVFAMSVAIAGLNNFTKWINKNYL